MVEVVKNRLKSKKKIEKKSRLDKYGKSVPQRISEELCCWYNAGQLMPSSSLKQASCLKLQPSSSACIPQTVLIFLQNKLIQSNLPLSNSNRQTSDRKEAPLENHGQCWLKSNCYKLSMNHLR